MKTFVVFVTLLTTMMAATANAQGGPGGDPAQMRQRMMERMKPQLVEKAKITEAEADKVLDIYAATMQQRRDIRTDAALSEEDKIKKVAALDEEATKKYKTIPLKDDQVKAVTDYFAEARPNMQRPGN
jgi:Spy/CpxP family protein refolding chaperone